MSIPVPATGLQLRSLVKSTGELELSLARVDIPVLAPNEVLVRIGASPVNPSDAGLLLGAVEIETLRAGGSAEHPLIKGSIPPGRMSVMAGRVDQSMAVGNEGAGVVVAAGTAAEAQLLIGKTVALFGGAMYAEYRVTAGASCLVLPDEITAAEGAACFVNPLTALCMIETLRLEKHTALVHTAAASNLGRMLNRICLQDGIGLVNIVRTRDQEDRLRAIGAVHVCNSSSADFPSELTTAIAATGATLAFDATGGGKLAGQILASMEAALKLKATSAYSRYGSAVHKQVYIYGGLDPGPTVLDRSFGMAWGIGGWLFTDVLVRIGAEGERRLHARIVAELKTTFASLYTKQIPLAGLLDPDNLIAIRRFATGEKYLIAPAPDSAGL